MNYLSKDQKEIMSLYALVMVGALMMLVPYSLIPFAGIACMSVGLVATYLYKWKYKSNEVMQFHMSYIISTIWWSTLILMVAMGLFFSVLWANGDWSAIYSVRNSLERGIILSESDMQRLIWKFIQDNATLIQWSALLTLPTYPIYLIYRTVSGVKKLIKQ